LYFSFLHFFWTTSQTTFPHQRTKFSNHAPPAFPSSSFLTPSPVAKPHSLSNNKQQSGDEKSGWIFEKKHCFGSSRSTRMAFSFRCSLSPFLPGSGLLLGFRILSFSFFFSFFFLFFPEVAFFSFLLFPSFLSSSRTLSPPE